ncbi:glycogen synthase [Ulvibacter antarcticus]|uniref:Glycogen synthase n=1 Tax=Ulvibacter antarcticus TaxID=442714 RepID=A0A3L9YA91_9FLAO|nr:glycogen/starch synthase [Ulvibacter antarcticus]RMA57304.1 starch synthase [Ulvibacter antarcticus]
MQIIHISAECYPVAKVGGLADVVGALPKYQNELGMKSKVIMPFYDNSFTQNNKFKKVFAGTLQLGSDSLPFTIKSLPKKQLGFELFLVDIPKLLHTSFVYSDDDTRRFMAFQIAVMQYMLQLKKKPDIVHCHDHHTGLIPFMMSHADAYEDFRQTPSVFTIHNAQYQGWFSHDQVNLIPKFPLSKIGLLDWDNSINPLATAIKCAWRVTTVSPSYMEELKSEANGLQSLITSESDKCVGILNGIDTSVWNTETDPFLVKNYSETTVLSGKKANKKWLCDEFKLNAENPLFVFIGRLVGEKGSDLFPQVFKKALQNPKLSILLLGSGNKDTEKELLKVRKQFPKNYNTFIGYNEALSHKMYAGADFLLMPSRVEPCGLNQMYALRYGTVPVVSKVGGLIDTVVDLNENGFGIIHTEITVTQIVEAINRAVEFYKKDTVFRKNRKTIMKIDHSWHLSAQKYSNLYNSLKV